MTFAHRVERLLRANSFDVVHAISPCRHVNVYQPRGGTVLETIERNLALLRTVPARHIKRCANLFNLKQRYLLAMERELLGRQDGPLVVAISDYVVRQLKRHYALPDERIRKIYNGVNADPATAAQREGHRIAIRREFDIRENHCLVLLIAHNFRLKGLQRWMEALVLLISSGATHIRSLVVGKGDSERWHRLAARLGVGDYLTFTGPTERVSEFHHAADVLVHPTYYDPCSRVVLEAMVAGLPCVTTRWDGAAEMIEDGKSGYVLSDPCEVQTLADRVKSLCDPTLRKAMGHAASTVADRVSMARHTTEVLELYNELAVPGGTCR
jgi:UDP-glucose:(heptosyl)LPS alpha-1,3-glucosyltransferase